ncbi:MAG TPA: methyltransferase domain-containing protein [Desulfotignum sp.]|nr:methyltransferase domain-containing protein [Desulfotignum sp.]
MDSDSQAAFGRRLTDILNHGALNLALALGYQLKIFDVLADLDKPVSCRELARAAALHPRYVQEWLGIMCTGRIIEIRENADGDTTYFLPPEHGALLTRKAGSGNMGVYTQEIPLLTQIAMARVTDDFAAGNGIPYTAYPRFQAFMAQLSHAKHRQVLIQHFLPGVDAGRILARLDQGIRVCDLGCGQGIALQLMARHFPASTFTGIDNDVPAIEAARQGAADLGLENLNFQVADASKIDANARFFQAFDYVTAFDAVHDQSHPLAALKGVRHMLAQGGLFSMVDIDAASHLSGNMDHPMGPFLYTVSLMHCMPVGLSDQGRGLGMMWGREQAVSLLRQAGFEKIQVIEMDHDPFNVHYLCRV